MEAGQVLVLLALLPVLHVLFTRVMRERPGTIVLSALVAHVAWHWMADRASAVEPFRDAILESLTLITLIRFSLIAISIVAVLWLARRVNAAA